MRRFLQLHSQKIRIPKATTNSGPIVAPAIQALFVDVGFVIGGEVAVKGEVDVEFEEGVTVGV